MIVNNNEDQDTAAHLTRHEQARLKIRAATGIRVAHWSIVFRVAFPSRDAYTAALDKVSEMRDALEKIAGPCSPGGVGPVVLTYVRPDEDE
jgi:hypothetical protein